MDAEIYLMMHRCRARELQHNVLRWRKARDLSARLEPVTVRLKARLGWVLVETGLRLVQRASLNRHMAG
ncbi:hypothetical protein [Sinosporangium siamense]|uniref:Uncharacterized protein n=1 Tax=Sinosporangium siamense TaxID=1367973 RepID=A0A919RL59_9ACTN|nr:hypothetical protein [Sinosporangium siamense]GII94424.1 hypothetical protein Ssi02_46550 [Sinosporangium siamense]